jgi:hypothetical protein
VRVYLCMVSPHLNRKVEGLTVSSNVRGETNCAEDGKGG